MCHELVMMRGRVPAWAAWVASLIEEGGPALVMGCHSGPWQGGCWHVLEGMGRRGEAAVVLVNGGYYNAIRLCNDLVRKEMPLLHQACCPFDSNLDGLLGHAVSFLSVALLNNCNSLALSVSYTCCPSQKLTAVTAM